mmetsp:Transcript_46949/g.121133  ORF Transcript_46949/g.121133 Transcript_46949/m.121133 type:complete len:200 (+) Transcript_46949:528-1127(+)
MAARSFELFPTSVLPILCATCARMVQRSIDELLCIASSFAAAHTSFSIHLLVNASSFAPASLTATPTCCCSRGCSPTSSHFIEVEVHAHLHSVSRMPAHVRPKGSTKYIIHSSVHLSLKVGRKARPACLNIGSNTAFAIMLSDLLSFSPLCFPSSFPPPLSSSLSSSSSPSSPPSFSPSPLPHFCSAFTIVPSRPNAGG